MPPLQTTSSNSNSCHKDLKHVFLLFRHGSRAPEGPLPSTDLKTFPGDWPQGLGQLTNNGRQQMYKLGQYFRQRYDGFLTDSPREVYAISRFLTRCFDSASCLLAGLYPPSDQWSWNKDIPWQPIQIFTDTTDYGEHLRDFNDKEIELLSRLPAPDGFPNAKSVFEAILEKSGVGTERLSRIASVAQYYFCARAEGYNVPEWVENSLEVLKWAMHLSNDIRYNKLKRIFAKESLSLLENSLKDKFVDGKYGDDRKIHVYCMSDLTLFALFKVISDKLFENVPFAASLVLEVYSEGEELSIKLLFLTDTEKEPELVPLAGGRKNPCPLNDFLNLIRCD